MKPLAFTGVLCALLLALTGIAESQDAPPTTVAPPGPEITTTTGVDTPTSLDTTATTEPVATTTVAPTTAVPTTAPAIESTSPDVPVAVQQCEPSYPTICLPPGVDVNCPDIPQYADFPVLAPDPFQLDGNDNDGLGCEENAGNVTGDPSITVPPTTVPPTTTSPPTTVPAQVAGTTQTNTTGTLPVTGSRSTLLAFLGFVVVALGAGLISTSGHLANPLTGRLRGGFTYTYTNRAGQVVVTRVTNSGRR